MDALTFLATLTGGAAAVNFLEKPTTWAIAYLNRVKSEPSETSPQDDPIERGQPQADPAPKEKRARWWWKKLLSLKGMLGLLFSPLQFPILVINSFLIAATFEVILNRAGQPLFWINLLGWEREVTDFDLYGVLVSLGQMISGSACYQARVEEERDPMIWWVALAALLSLVGFEVGASVYRGLKLDGPWNAALSGKFAFGIATIEVVVGIFMLDFFLGPLLLASLWSVTSPIWALADWWERRKARRRWFWVRRKANPLALALAYPLAMVDQALMEPLRRLDNVVAGLISRGKHESNKGGQDNAEKLSEERHERAPVPGDGSDPNGMRHHTTQTPGGVDHSGGYHHLDPQ